MDHPVVAIYDANILYPAPLRDLFVRLAQAGLVQAKWTNVIHEEWMRNVLKDRPDLSPERLARTKALMDSAVRDCLVSDHEALIESLALPDPNDRHVLAAAIHGGASVIITYNLKDFTSDILSQHGIEALHPDEFLSDLLDEATDLVVATIKRQRESLRHPTKTTEELLDTFANQGLTQFVARLRPLSNLL